MNLNNSVLEDVRISVGLSKDTTDFDTDLIMHINGAIGKLNQNGIGSHIFISDILQTWNDLLDPLQVEGNKYFHMVPLFISLSTKIIFDPPPPSTVEVYSRNIDQTLWRLKIAYEDFTTTTTTTSY